MPLLYCDPSKPHQVIFRYLDTVVDLDKPKADELLRAMVELIQDQPVKGIVLVNQSDSFTTVRVLATIANALAYSLNLKLYDGDQLVTQIIPRYSKAAV